MFASLSPIRAADLPADADTHDLLMRIDALGVVLDTIARLAGHPARPGYDMLLLRAELPAIVGALPLAAIAAAARDLDTLGMALQAGLLALEKARITGRLNRAAAAVLHDEARASYQEILATINCSARG